MGDAEDPQCKGPVREKIINNALSARRPDWKRKRAVKVMPPRKPSAQSSPVETPLGRRLSRAEIERLLGAPIDDASLGSLLQPNVANVLKHNEAAVMVHDEGFSQKPEHTSQVVDPSCPSEIDHPSRRGNWRGAVGEITLFEKFFGYPHQAHFPRQRWPTSKRRI